MADSHSTSAAPAALSPCSVYRLKHNPSWTKFGMHPAMLADINARSDRPTSRRASSRGSSAASSAVPSANASRLSTASARQPASSSSLAAVGAQAALRHEHKQAHAASRSMNLRATAFSACGTRGASQSLVSDSVLLAPRARGGSDVKACAPESASLGQPAATRGESLTASTPVPTPFRDRGGSCDHGSETPRTPNDARSSDFTDSSWRAETTRDPSLQPSVLSLRAASSSRAKDSHLMGSAALVEVAGPLDALYVPLRRPAPRGCVATHQHFSIFERTHCQRVPGRSATEARAAVAAHREAHIGHRGVVGGSPETDTYRTTNSAYGRGC
ncbi:hypothetical protein LMJF_35_1355 [Leishmania major strain Friedlin]|uniref:Uncharacterized protein n=1 Tax=Leishmania major TaxID=5664 RepID=E9AEV8_LEIMA|nr:hypothetical protein LMJF_35_1355 [Leishmania major strain Friedlin]CAG9582487.1 hypothetical_protein_-_conserved [Leishmania major strain Friedlin]CBZ12762.1 hypothetical protein LMJF_35_1355 [Leishmania major strain Friedlin]|eukprot:XP_003722528.1 hypothetical protein LMJF_35_1355 [Leishmania major strain Friedlin]